MTEFDPQSVTVEQLQAAHAEAGRERAWWREHRAELQIRYAGRFIAVRPSDGEVLVTAAQLDGLLNWLATNGHDARQTWIRWVTPRPIRGTGRPR